MHCTVYTVLVQCTLYSAYTKPISFSFMYPHYSWDTDIANYAHFPLIVGRDSYLYSLTLLNSLISGSHRELEREAAMLTIPPDLVARRVQQMLLPNLPWFTLPPSMSSFSVILDEKIWISWLEMQGDFFVVLMMVTPPGWACRPVIPSPLISCWPGNNTEVKMESEHLSHRDRRFFTFIYKIDRL